ncbi:MAG: TonB-dependent receptor [Saprospiraceae bacterium]|nr:TonB-dependent receptor [Saprospiraceae bacterium]
MKKLFAFLVLLVSTVSFALAQNPSKVSIQGIVADSLGEDLPFATVMLLNPKDSALVNFTRSDDKGGFSFKSIKNTAYLLKISYVGYLPYQQHLDPSVSELEDLGRVKIKPITKELLEVVIKTAKAPLSIKGDTIEYNASSFKVPPGSTVEDLLRRLPGIDVDADGNIKAQGKDVKKVYVDGKSFFGDDPKAATKNLDANVISKVQVFTEKTDQAKLTGVDDGKKEKAMNLELKDEFKKGAFGKVSAAVGTSDRWAGRGNYNRFNKKEQFSVLGYANNINQTGVNWEDYGEFKGQNSFNNNDNGDFGFNGGGGFRYYNSGDDVPWNNFDGRGFTKNGGAGVNYNFDNKKTKWSSSYFYNQTQLNLDQSSLRQTFLQDSSFYSTDTTAKADFRGNHSIAARLEKEFDSTNVLIVKGNLRFSGNNGQTIQNQLFTNASKLTTRSLNLDNSNDLNSFRVSSTAIFRHRFKKKGRNFAISGGYNNSQSDGTENLFSLNKFFSATTFTEQIRQLNTNTNATEQVKSSLLFTEPLSKKMFWETFYNFSNTDNQVNRQVNNPEKNNERVDNLSVFYDNSIQYNRLGTSLRYAHSGVNITTGIAAQRIALNGEYAMDKDLPLLTAPINRTYNNWTPNFNAEIELPNNKYVGFTYGYNVREPQINDLQPIPNVNNPAFRTEGNPDLRPERNHSAELSFNYWNPASFANMNMSIEYNKFDDQIVYSQLIENVDKIGIRTTTKPINLSGGQRTNLWSWINYPIIKTKLNINGNINLNASTSPSFVNNVSNETTNFGGNISMGLNATPNAKLILSVRGSYRFSNIEYSIQKEQNQKIRNQSIDASIKWNFAKKTFLESNFNYAAYQNERFGFDQKIPIWNLSVRYLLMKNNKLEARLAAFDLLNRQLNITQTGTQNYVITNTAQTLRRYFMLSLTYNMRGHEDKLKKNGW